MKITLQKPDSIGAIASMLCVVHCLLTPLIFIAHSCCKEGCDAAPTWWKSIDFIFLTISFISIYQSTKTTTQDAMKPILWSLWSLLCFLIINEKNHLLEIPETISYITAITLAFFHIYNLRYCQCNEKCCSSINKVN